MIAFVKGFVSSVDDDIVVLDIGSIGLSVSVPLHMLDPRPVIGNELLLYTHLQIREDAWTLYGFSNKEQLKIFRLLLNISGVGARTALSIVDAITPSRLHSLVANQEIKPMTAISGIGKKTAERILLELKDKFPSLPGNEVTMDAASYDIGNELDKDLLAALKQLGYSAVEARSFAIQAQENCAPGTSSEQMLREALKIAMHS